MIVIAGTIPIQPDKRKEAIAAATIMAKETNLEDGCLHYQFYFDINDPNLILVFEEWESDEALQAHFASEHMATFRKHLPSFVAGPGAIKKYEIKSINPL